MFSLSQPDLRKRVLGCGDGPASFNAGMHRRGLRTVSIDPLYQFEAAEIRTRVDEAYDEIVAQTRENRDAFVWKRFRSVDDLARARLAAMNDFLSDYPDGRAEGRYRAGELPRLPAADRHYELALCSHLLFLYDEQLDLQFHLSSIFEMCRVAAEVRIFPLVGLSAPVSPHLDPVMRKLAEAGLDVGVEEVDYEFRRGGNTMLRVRAV